MIIDKVPASGGTTQWIEIISPSPDMQWTISGISFSSSTASDGRRLVNHGEPTVEIQAENPLDPTVPFVEGQTYPASRKFRVKFPKIYYPNRQIEIGAILMVKVGGMEKPVVVNQASLQPKTFVAMGLHGEGDNYGRLWNTYNRGWDGHPTSGGSYGLTSIPGFSFWNGQPVTSGTTESQVNADMADVSAVPDGVTYLHVTAQGTVVNTPWGATNDYIANRNAFTFLQQQGNSTTYANSNRADSPLKLAGYPDVHWDGNADDGLIDTRHEDTKIFKFLFEHGHTVLTPAGITQMFNDDGTSCYMDYIDASSWPKTGVVLVTKGTTNVMNTAANTNMVKLMIDVKHRFVWIGESMYFWYDTELSGNRGTFLDNLMYFVANAAKYGSAFSDLLLEETSDNPEAMPAPWDDVWDGRADGGTDNRGVPTK